MNLRSLALTVFLIVFAFTALSCGAAATPVPPTPTPTPHPGLALVSSRCSTCHPIGLVENSKFSEQGWQVVVDRMVASGAPLNEEQKKQAVEYLTIAYPMD
jgi:hypothetical protein